MSKQPQQRISSNSDGLLNEICNAFKESGRSCTKREAADRAIEKFHELVVNGSKKNLGINSH